MAEIMSALAAFSTDVQGVPVFVSSGDLFYADDPVVTGRESLFGAVSVRRTVLRPPPNAQPAGHEETADASPGSRRKATVPPVVDTPRGPKTANASATTKTPDAVSTSSAARTPPAASSGRDPDPAPKAGRSA